ncbi:hypothetical protein B5C34_13800 [Pacificimonas flava]|uniref:DUF998 domain-containing protein n=2 Tax=Pacificimonas TaxID=1960290 RepID=A0A219B7S5_9SPHN|nr:MULTISPECIES: DUF998 domain-containing protein [Pacificimonas]MBZ6379899.1 DUF998 domain-containing protein [Pacificimonas aurantium]OWV34425.1 hypothetical protein B5C34_13800 [Pacificimonas flava]
MIWLVRLALLLTLVTIAGDLAAMLSVEGYDPVRQTISELAAGDGQRFEDPALVALALSLLVTCILLFRHGDGGGENWKRIAGLGFLLLMAATVLVIAFWDAYDAPGSAMAEGSFALTAHRKMVWVLGGAFFGATTLLAARLGRLGGSWRRTASLVLAFAWLLTAPVFFFVPTDIDGLGERGLAALVILWIWLAATSAVPPLAERRPGA